MNDDPFWNSIALDLYKSNIQPWLNYCCHCWVDAPDYYLDMLDMLRKRLCKTVDLTTKFTASLEHLAHRQNVASLGLLNRNYFVICPSDLAEMVPLPHSRGRSIRYSNKLNDFSFTIPTCSTSTVSFLAQLDSEIIYL